MEGATDKQRTFTWRAPWLIGAVSWDEVILMMKDAHALAMHLASTNETRLSHAQSTIVRRRARPTATCHGWLWRVSTPTAATVFKSSRCAACCPLHKARTQRNVSKASFTAIRGEAQPVAARDGMYPRSLPLPSANLLLHCSDAEDGSFVRSPPQVDEEYSRLRPGKPLELPVPAIRALFSPAAARTAATSPAVPRH